MSEVLNKFGENVEQAIGSIPAVLCPSDYDVPIKGDIAVDFGIRIGRPRASELPRSLLPHRSKSA